MYAHMYIYLYIRIYTYNCMCVYIYIYIHIMCIYIYIVLLARVCLMYCTLLSFSNRHKLTDSDCNKYVYLNQS